MSDSESRKEPEACSPLEREEPARLCNSRPSAARRTVLLATLATLVGLWGLARYQQRHLEVEAAPLVEKAVQENHDPELDVVSKLTVSRDALFFGTPHAKVEVFVRNTAQPESARIRGIEYHYALENGTWLLKDSGSCTGEECTIRGLAAFERQ